MAKGLPKSLIKKYGISKKAWSVYRAGKSRVKKAVHRKANKRKTTYRYAVRHMAKRKRSSRRSFLSFGTVAKFVKIGALVAPAAARAMGGGSTQDKINGAISDYTGFNMATGQFNFGDLAKGWMPYIATSLVIVGIQKLNGIVRRL